MIRFHRWLDRVTDRRPVVRRSAARRRGPGRLLLLLFAVVLLIVGLLVWPQATQARTGRMVEDLTGAMGGFLHDGEPVRPARNGWLVRHKISSMSVAIVRRPRVSRKGGDNGR